MAQSSYPAALLSRSAVSLNSADSLVKEICYKASQADINGSFSIGDKLTRYAKIDCSTDPATTEDVWFNESTRNWVVTTVNMLDLTPCVSKDRFYEATFSETAPGSGTFSATIPAGKCSAAITNLSGASVDVQLDPSDPSATIADGMHQQVFVSPTAEGSSVATTITATSALTGVIVTCTEIS